MKINTPLILGVLTLAELIVAGSIGATAVLWCGYGLYKFLND